MLIINADDWGRSRMETDTALRCFQHGAITRVSAMVFMEDSERAADIAKTAGIDVGLHVNLTEAFVTSGPSSAIVDAQSRTARFLKSNKYAQLVYNPFLCEAFRHTYRAQADEFLRLYGKAPSHVDGHQHMHLCANMLIDGIIPIGQRVRRNFSFESGEKGWLNRNYRRLSDWWLKRRYQVTDYFFALSRAFNDAALNRMISFARRSSVELMTHPVVEREYALLLTNSQEMTRQGVKLETYAEV
jgi:predicted glycoside hydrolase/deacetylase ChbG (UPF0249 family)